MPEETRQGPDNPASEDKVPLDRYENEQRMEGLDPPYPLF